MSKGKDCLRVRVEILDENYYLLIGDDFVSVTVPRENDPMRSRERIIAETLCKNISAGMRARRMIRRKR